MKRAMMLFLAAGLLLSMTSGARAADVNIKGQWQNGFSWADRNPLKSANASVDRFKASTRLRTQIDIVASDSLKGVVFFEVGHQNWGTNDAALGTDGKVVKVRYSYVDWNIPETDAKVRMGLQPFDLGGVRALCETLDVPYIVRETEIGKVIFEERKEKNPCSLCAKMRRGALVDLCLEVGANKLALGHHRDDAIETLFLSMLYEGRIHTFHPVTHLTRKGITQIRPLVYLPEKHVLHMVKTLGLPVVPSPCPANGRTKRDDVRELLNAICRRKPDARELLLSALQNEAQYGLWEKPKD